MKTMPNNIRASTFSTSLLFRVFTSKHGACKNIKFKPTSNGRWRLSAVAGTFLFAMVGTALPNETIRANSTEMIEELEAIRRKNPNLGIPESRQG